MKQFLYKKLILLFIPYFLLASTGVNIHEFLCNCFNEKIVSIFHIHHDCNHHDTIEKKCISSTCCVQNVEHDCGDEVVKYFKFDFSGYTQDIQFLTVLPFLVKQLPTISFEFIKETTSVAFYQNKAPPLPYGQNLRKLLQSFLC